MEKLKASGVFVRKQWINLMETMGISDTVYLDWWSILERRYSEDWRYYHTLSHLCQMLELFHQWKERFADLVPVQLAIYFHDIVYDPQASDNEICSILVFEKFSLDANLPETVTSRVSQLIKTTINHSVGDNTDDLDLCLFLDLDLSVLGLDNEAYKSYAEHIRKEYIHFNNEAYREGRTKVLHSILNASSVFSSEDFRYQFEEQARKNMMAEIKDLQSVGEGDGF